MVRGQLERELRRLEAGDAFVALELGYDADDRGVRAAFLAATKRLHPNRFARTAAPVRALANEVFLRIKDAYQALESGEGRARVLAKIGRTPAAAAPPPVVGEGSGAVRQPFPNLPRVVLTPPSGTRLPDVPRPPGPVSVDDVRKQVLQRERKTDEEFAAAVKRLEQGFAENARREFHRLAVSDPGDKKFRVWMHHAKGCELQIAGRAEEARAEFRRALDLDDGFGPARKALDALDGTGDKPPGGLFSRLFRK